MPTVDELYTTVDAKDVSYQVVIANQAVGQVFGITWSFSIGTVPTATIRVPYPAPATAIYFADVYINVGFNGVNERVFTGKVLNIGNSEKEAIIECAGLSMFLERPNEDVAISISSKTNIIAIAEVFAAAGIDYFTTTIPSWTMGTNNPSVLEFQTFAEAITKIAEIEGGRWAEMPTGQLRVAVYDPIAAPTIARTYFSMTLTGLTEAYPSDLTSADGRPRIRTIRRVEKVQDAKNKIHVRGATVTEEIAPGVESSHDIERTQSAESPWVKAPDGTPAYNDMVFTNDLVDTFDKADEVALRLLALHSRRKEELTLQVEGDPLRRLGDSIRVEDAAYAGLTDRWFLEGYRTTLTQTSFITSLKLIGTGASANLDPVAAFTYKAVWIVIDDALYVLVTLDGTPSFDPDGTIASYAWSDNQAPEVATGATAVLNICKKTFEAGGDIVPEWQVTLTVTDNDGNTDAVTQIIDLTSCAVPPVPNVVLPSLYAALGNNYSGSQDAAQNWQDSAGTDVISVAGDPTDSLRAVFGRDDGGIYLTEDSVVSAPSNVLAAVGSPIISLAWDEANFDIVWALTQDARVYRSTNAGTSWGLYQNLRIALTLPSMRGAKIVAIGGGLVVVGGKGVAPGDVIIALDRFKNNTWTRPIIGGELATDLAGAPSDVYIRDIAFNGGSELWEVAIILNSASFTPAVFFTTNLIGDGSDWKRATGLPAKSEGIWIAADLVRDQFVFAYNDQSIYEGDVAAGVLAASAAAAALDAGDTPNHGFWMGQFIPGIGSVYIVSTESIAPDGNIYISCDRFATVGKIRPAAGFDAMPANAIAKMSALGAIPICPETYLQDEAGTESVVRLDGAFWTDLGGDPITGGSNADLKRLGGAFYRLNQVQVATLAGAQGSLERANADEVDSNIWTEVIPYNFADETAVMRYALAIDGTLWAISKKTGAWNDGIDFHVWKSVDNGITWVRVYTGFELDPSSFTPRGRDIACDPLDANNIVITAREFNNNSFVYYSTDGGASWTRVAGPGSASAGLNLRWGDSHRVVMGIFNGVYVSDSFGATWTRKLTGTLGGAATPWIIRSPKSRQQFVYIEHKSSGGAPIFRLYLSRNNGENWSQFADQDDFVPLGWSATGWCWAGTFLEDGSLVIGEHQGNDKILRNPNPFALPTPAWQDVTYNLGALIATISGRGIASKRVELEP